MCSESIRTVHVFGSDHPKGDISTHTLPTMHAAVPRSASRRSARQVESLILVSKTKIVTKFKYRYFVEVIPPDSTSDHDAHLASAIRGLTSLKQDLAPGAVFLDSHALKFTVLTFYNHRSLFSTQMFSSRIVRTMLAQRSTYVRNKSLKICLLPAWSGLHQLIN